MDGGVAVSRKADQAVDAVQRLRDLPSTQITTNKPGQPYARVPAHHVPTVSRQMTRFGMRRGLNKAERRPQTSAAGNHSGPG